MMGTELPTDAELIARSLRGDRPAANALAERYYGFVYTIARSRLPDHESALDLAQEVFLRAALNLSSLKNHESFAPWLAQATRRLAKDWNVKGRRRSELVPMVPMEVVEMTEPATVDGDVRDRIDANDRARVLRDCITKLPDDQRELICLHFEEGLDKSTLARRLGVHPSTVGRQLEKALEVLRGLLPTDMGGMEGVGRIRARRPAREAAAASAILAGILSMPADAAASLAGAAATSNCFVTSPLLSIHMGWRIAAAAAALLLLLGTSFVATPGGRAVLAGDVTPEREEALREFFRQIQADQRQRNIPGIIAAHDPQLIARHEGRTPDDVERMMLDHLSTYYQYSELWMEAEIVAIERDRSWSLEWEVPVTAVRSNLGLSAYFYEAEGIGWQAIAFESRADGE